MRRIALLLVACLAGCSPGNEAPEFTLYLVRHAEKMNDGSDNPELTAAGHGRAARLAGWVTGKEIGAVWSSNFRRTMQTAGPAAAALGIGMQRYDPDDPAALAAQLRAAGLNALVVGHSNTIPPLAAVLCDCVVAEMSEDEYEQLLVLEVFADGKVTLTTLEQREAFAD